MWRPCSALNRAKIKAEMTPPRVCFKTSLELLIVYQRQYVLYMKIKTNTAFIPEENNKVSNLDFQISI